MSIIARKEVPLIIGVLIISVILINYFTPNLMIDQLSKEFQSWAIILSAYAAIVGILVYTVYHGNKIMKERSLYSMWALAVAFITIFIGLLLGTGSPEYSFLIQDVMMEIYMATSAFIGFFIAPAAYRAFRARNVEATILLVAAAIIMLKNIPIGNVMVPGILPFGNWIQSVASLGANRGFTIAFALGLIIAGVRQMLGLGRGE